MGTVENQASSNDNKQQSDNKKSGNPVLNWVDTNLTMSVAERCASTLSYVIEKVFSAPFEISMNLIEVIQNKKYSKYILGIWSAIGITTMALSLVLTIINGSFPLNAWSLGVVLASLVVIFIAKHPLTIDVKGDLSQEIEEAIKNLENMPTVEIGSDNTNVVSARYYDDDDEESIDDILEEDEESIDDILDEESTNELLDDILSCTEDDYEELPSDLQETLDAIYGSDNEDIDSINDIDGIEDILNEFTDNDIL